VFPCRHAFHIRCIIKRVGAQEAREQKLFCPTCQRTSFEIEEVKRRQQPRQQTGKESSQSEGSSKEGASTAGTDNLSSR